MEWQYSSTTMAGLLQSMAENIWPGCGPEQIEKVLAARMANFDDVDGLEDLLGIEWVTDMFDKSTADEVLDEIRSAKSIKVSRSEFLSDYDRFKDRAFSPARGRKRAILEA
eukprot:6663403-Pyramimonas_sp.AAC.1